MENAAPSLRIVFDLDGTLIDSAPDIRAVANAVLAAEGAPPLSLAETRSFIGHGAPMFVERMRQARSLPDADHARLLDGFAHRYETAVDLTVPYPGVREALGRIAQAGHRMGLCTNKPEKPTRAVLRHLALESRFDVVVGGDSLPSRKPDPAPLALAFDALGSGPCVYVGDSEVDAETARRAKVPFLLFTRGYRKTPVADMPHRIAFDDWSAFPDMLAQLQF